MKTTYYVRITPRVIDAIDAKLYHECVAAWGEEWGKLYQPIEAWNRYHAKQIGMTIRKCADILEDKRPTAADPLGQRYRT